MQQDAWTATLERGHGNELIIRANDRVDSCAGKNTVQDNAWTATLARGRANELFIHANSRVDSHAGKNTAPPETWTAALNRGHGDEVVIHRSVTRTGLLRLCAVTVSLCLALPASSAWAQKDRFVASVRDLATAVVAADPGGAPTIKAAIDRMATSLAEWDRTISALEARISPDLENARGQRAYDLHLELAVTYLERGRLADALRHLEQASAAEPTASDAQVLRAVVLERSGKRDAAATLWRSVWQIDRDNPTKAYQVLRSDDGGANERAAAATAMRTVYERLLVKEEAARPLSLVDLDLVPDTFSAAPIVGDAATAEGFAALAEARYDDALVALRRDAASGEAPRAHFEKAREFEKTNRVHEARGEYEAAVAGTLSGRSLLHMGIGRLAQVEGDFAGAVAAFTRAIQLNPNNVNMHRELAFAYAGQGATEEAFTELVAALLLNPRDAQTFADIGRLFLDAGRDADALPPLSRALAIAPERFETRYAIATALMRLGRQDEAAREMAAFERAQREALERRRQDLVTSAPTGSPR